MVVPQYISSKKNKFNVEFIIGSTLEIEFRFLSNKTRVNIQNIMLLGYFSDCLKIIETICDVICFLFLFNLTWNSCREAEKK